MKLSRRAFEIIQEQAHRELPYECCGLFAGVRQVDRRGGVENIVHEVAPCRNVLYHGRENGFEISWREYEEVEREARSLGLEIVGSYHSHIDTAAVPSKHDIDFARPGHSMLILSISPAGSREVTAWHRREAGGFHQEPIRVTQE